MCFTRLFLLAVFVAMISTQNVSANGNAALLEEYINLDDGALDYSLVEEKRASGGTFYILHLTSQEWRGREWEHWLTIYAPEEPVHPDAGILIIEGGNNTDEPPSLNDIDGMAKTFITTQINVPLAVLQQVPNQPLLGGLREDALIAETFERFLGEGDKDWPLLLPMTKSGVRAMDAIEAFLKEQKDLDIERFIVGGGSKRGWTSYLTAAVDERVAGLVPVVIDMLNLTDHMERQMQSYGEYSDMIHDYSERNLIKRMSSEEGRKLAELVDPYYYRDRLTMPKLIILGTNDPYWVADAADLYFDDLPDPKSLHYGVEVGHDVGLESIPTLLYFFNSTLADESMPVLEWERNGDGSKTVRWESDRAEARLYTAESETRDFRDSSWQHETLRARGKQVTINMEGPEEGYLAYFVEVRFPDQRLSGTTVPAALALSTPINILPETFPYDAKGDPETGTR